MKELNKKVFKIIFLILSLFIIIFIIIYNVSIYKKEYDNIHRNLTFIEEKNNYDDMFKPNYNSNMIRPMDKSFDNMMIMDYEVYSVILNNGEDHNG